MTNWNEQARQIWERAQNEYCSSYYTRSPSRAAAVIAAALAAAYKSGQENERDRLTDSVDKLGEDA